MRRTMAVLTAVVGLAWSLAVMHPAMATNNCPGGTISGVTVNDNVVVLAGQTCVITSATINGNIVVRNNGSLQLDVVTVNGDVTGTKPNSFTTKDGLIAGFLSISGSNVGGGYSVCGTTVQKGIEILGSNGNINIGNAVDGSLCGLGSGRVTSGGGLTIKNVTGNVEVGSPAGGPRNTWSGPMIINGTTGSVNLVRNTVSGAGKFNNNSNTLTINENTFNGTLACSGNGSVVGSGNTSANKTGQCIAV